MIPARYVSLLPKARGEKSGGEEKSGEKKKEKRRRRGGRIKGKEANSGGRACSPQPTDSLSGQTR